MFLKPDGQRSAAAGARPAGLDRTTLEWPTTGAVFSTLQRRCRRCFGTPHRLDRRPHRLYEDDRRLAGPRLSGVRASLPSDTSFDFLRSRARARDRRRRFRTDTEFATARRLLDVLLEYPIAIGPLAVLDRIRASARLGAQVLTVLRFMPPDGAERALRVPRRSRPRPARSALVQAAAASSSTGFFHILERHRSPAVPVLPGDSVPPVRARCVLDRHGVHGRALDHADRVGLRHGAGRLWFPPLVETLIAASIVYMALENIVAPGAAAAAG